MREHTFVRDSDGEATEQSSGDKLRAHPYRQKKVAPYKDIGAGV